MLYFKFRYPKSRILAFEPDPELCKILESNIRRNDIYGVRILDKAV